MNSTIFTASILGVDAYKIEEDKNNYFLEMKKMILDLRPVVQLVKVQYPELSELFDTILAEHEAENKKCPTCNK